MAQKPNTLNTGKTPRQIERDIDETRSDMSETLDAISDRFDPSNLKDQAMDQAKDFLSGPVADIGSSLLDTVKQHPVPALAAAISIGWLVVKGGESEQDRRFEDDYRRRTGRYPAPGYASYARRTGRRYDSGYDYDANGDSDSGRSLADKAGDKASQAKDKVSGLADQATDRLHDVGDHMQDYRRSASNWLEQQLHQNPMLVGAVALAAGALVGLSVPETQPEHELMGRQSDRLIEQAKDVADEKIGQAKQVLQETAEEAKSKAKDVAETAKQEAKKQDLDKAPKALKTGSSSTSGTKPSSAQSPNPGQSGMEALEAKTKQAKAKASSGSGKS